VFAHCRPQHHGSTRKRIPQNFGQDVLDVQCFTSPTTQASPLVYTNMGWLGDSSHGGQGCQAWTAVGLPPRYPLWCSSEWRCCEVFLELCFHHVKYILGIHHRIQVPCLPSLCLQLHRSQVAWVGMCQSESEASWGHWLPFYPQCVTVTLAIPCHKQMPCLII